MSNLKDKDTEFLLDLAILIKGMKAHSMANSKYYKEPNSFAEGYLCHALKANITENNHDVANFMQIEINKLLLVDGFMYTSLTSVYRILYTDGSLSFKENARLSDKWRIRILNNLLSRIRREIKNRLETA